MLKEEAIPSAATSGGRATKIANYLTNPTIGVDAGASNVSFPNQTMTKPHSVSLKDQTLVCEGEETLTSNYHPTSVCEGEETKKDVVMLESNDANVRDHLQWQQE